MVKECEKCHEKVEELVRCPFLFLDRNHPRRDMDGYVQFWICKECARREERIIAASRR
jgi:hypothetical protein